MDLYTKDIQHAEYQTTPSERPILSMSSQRLTSYSMQFIL